MLRDQISLALKGVLLHQEVVNQTMQRERSVQERIATAKRMQALSVLAGGVAHDLNNALGPLVALPDVILGELGDVDPDQVPSVADLRFDVESIKAAALRATQTVKDLLTLGRQGRTTKEPLDLNSAVSACLASEPLRFMHEASHDVKIALDLHPRPLLVQASEAHLVRALGNLVRNAVEAIDGPGQVVVKTESVSLPEPTSGFETVDSGDYAVVSVSDTGPGIPQAALARIFEPFFSSKRVGANTGSGLGLAIVHSVVKEHEGFVDVASSVGGGTRFILYFPRPADMPAQYAEAPIISRVPARILVVDDEPVQLRTARRVLTHLGYHVDTLQSGRQAYDMFARTEQVLRSQTGPRPIRKSPYDLIILDMLLNEEHDGLDIFEQIQELFPKQKVIIASGHAPSDRAALAVDRGLAWLVKPYTTDSLARAVEAALAELPSLTVVKLSSHSPPTSPHGRARKSSLRATSSGASWSECHPEASLDGLLGPGSGLLGFAEQRRRPGGVLGCEARVLDGLQVRSGHSSARSSRRGRRRLGREQSQHRRPRCDCPWRQWVRRDEAARGTPRPLLGARPLLVGARSPAPRPARPARPRCPWPSRRWPPPPRKPPRLRPPGRATSAAMLRYASGTRAFPLRPPRTWPSPP